MYALFSYWQKNVLLSMYMATITPLFSRVVVLPESQEETTASGIVLAETANKEKPAQGKVIAVGPEAKVLKEGDTVLFKKYSPTEVTIDNEDYFLLDEEDVLATLA